MAPPAVFGREDELAVADTFLESALEGVSLLRLEGEAGTGKTTAWLELIHRAGERGFRVQACRPAQAETKLAGSALADLLEPVSAGELDPLPAPQRRALDIALLRAEPGDPRQRLGPGAVSDRRARRGGEAEAAGAALSDR